MNRSVKRIMVVVLGWIFLVLGVAGLFLPFLQGILFILVGLIILSTEYAWAHHLLRRIKDRFPKLGHIADQATEKAKTWMGRLTGHSTAD